MHHPRSTSSLIAIALAIGVASPRRALAAPSSGDAADPFANALPTRDTSAPERRGGGGSASVDESTGAAAYSIPLELPPGRAGMTPSLSLAYSSSGALRGGLAVGWAMPLPTIELDPAVSDGTAYLASGQRLIATPDGYRGERDQSFARYEYDATNDTWRVRTLEGGTQVFAVSNASTRWHLSQQIDAMGNRIDYAWAWSEAGPDAPRPYGEWILSSIEYTGNAAAGLAPHAKVDFVYAGMVSCGGIPLGAAIDHHFAVPRMSGSRTLEELSVSVRDTQGGPWRESRRYVLAHHKDSYTCESGTLRYLTGVDTYAYSAAGVETAAPPLRFEYGPTERTLDRTLELWRFGGGERGTFRGPTSTLLDFDGDGWVDRLTAVTHADGCSLDVRRGTGVGRFASASTVIDLPSAPWYQDADHPTSIEGCSLNGQRVYRGKVSTGGAATHCFAESAVVSYDLIDWDADGLVDIMSHLHETSIGIAGGDFAEEYFPATDDGPDDPGDCDGSCPAGMEQTGCEGNTPTCACPAGFVHDHGQCIVPDCPEGTAWDGWREECRSLDADACSTGDFCGLQWDPGDPIFDPDYTVCERPEPVPQTTFGNGFRLYVQRNLGGATVEAFDDALEVDSPIELPPNPSPTIQPSFLRPGVPSLFDITGDGYLDVLSLTLDPTGGVGHPPLPGSDDGRTLYVWPGSGSSSFSGVVPWTLPAWDQDMLPMWWDGERVATTRGTIELRDLDGDGLADIVANQVWPDEGDEVEEDDFDAPVIAIHNGGDRMFLEPVPLGLGNVVDKSRAENDHLFPQPPPVILDGARAHIAQLVDVDLDGLPEHLVMPTADRVADEALSRVAFRLDGGTSHDALMLPPEWEAFEQAIVSREGLWHRYNDSIDLTGDGLPDMVTWETRAGSNRFDGDATVRTEAAGTPPLRLLTAIDNGRGGQTRFEYAPSTEPGFVTLGNGHLSARSLVRRVLEFDGATAPITTTYRYADPHHGHDSPLASTRGTPSFLGFGTVTVEHSGQLGDDSTRTVSRYGFAPTDFGWLDWTGHPVGSETYVKQLDGTHRLVEMTSQTWRNLPIQGNSGANITVPDELTTWSCGLGANAVTCPLAPDALTSKTETWEPYAFTLGGPALHYQHTGVRVAGSDVDEARVAHTQYLVTTVDGLRRQVTIEVTRGTDTEVLSRTSTFHDGRLLPSETWSYRDATDVVVSRQGFDEVGNVAWTMRPSEVVGEERVSTIGYDEHGLFPQIIIDELGHETVQEHDVATGTMLSSSGPDPEAAEQYLIDGFGRVLVHLRTTAPDGAMRAVETFYYLDSAPNRVIHTQIQDHETGAYVRSETIHDGLGRVVEQIAHRQLPGEPDAVVRYTYDLGGALETMQVPDPRGGTGFVTYAWIRDGQGRPVQTIRPDGSGEDIAYEGGDTIVTERSPLGTRTRLHDNAFGELQQVHEDPLHGVTTYHHDALGRVDEIRDADDNLTLLQYDMQDNRTAIVRGGRTWQYSYDRDGNLALELSPVPFGASPDQYATVTTYDVLGRVHTVNPASRGMTGADRERLGIGKTSYVYDTQRIGNVAAIELPFGLVELEVDVEGRISRERRTIEVPGTNVTSVQEVERTYDAMGAARTVRWDDGTEWSYHRDSRGMVDEVAWRDRVTGALEPLATYRRNLAGRATERIGAGGQLRKWSYDENGRPTYDQIWNTSTGITYADRGYGYDGDEIAEVWGAVDGMVADASYQYDARHRLIGAQGPLAYRVDLRFSDAGNVTHADVEGALDAPDRDVTYDYADFEPQAVEALVDPSGAAIATMAYDLAGNLVERNDPDGSRLQLTWDGDDMLREVLDSDRGPEVYLFGPNGERIAAVRPDGVKLWFAESETHLDEDGGVQRRYHHVASGEPVARIEDGEAIELQYADSLSNLMLAVNLDGGVTASFLYGAFGELVAASGEKDHSRRFNGKEHDSVSDLRHYGYRSYDPMLLRWISGDPKYRFAPDAAWTEPQRANLYAFSLNNPMRWLDPDGLDVSIDPEGGHHYVPKEISEKLPISEEALEVFRQRTTGWPKDVDPHGWSAAHVEYNNEVIDEFNRWAGGKGWGNKQISQMTAAQADEFIDHLKKTDDQLIRTFLDPHEEVIRMARAGKTVEQINEYWTPIKRSFTKKGGWVGTAAQKLGRYMKKGGKLVLKAGKYAGPIGKVLSVVQFGVDWNEQGIETATKNLVMSVTMMDVAIPLGLAMGKGLGDDYKKRWEQRNGKLKPGQIMWTDTNPYGGKQ